MDSKLMLVVIGVAALAFGHSEAIKCYSCSSETEANCRDPFNSYKVPTCTGGTCTTGWANLSGVTAVVRACYSVPVERDLCADTTTLGITGRACVCSTDYCNNGKMVKPIPYNVITGVAVATVMSVAWMKQS